MKFEFSRQILKNSQISDFMEMRPAGAELSHTNRRTDKTKLTVACRNFANKHKSQL